MTEQSMLDLWGEHFEDWRTISEFFDWLNAQGVFLAEDVVIVEGLDPRVMPTTKKLMDLFCESVGVNQTQLEKERRALLDGVREKQELE